HGLTIDSDDVKCKWSIRHITKTLIVKQCICGSYRDKVVTSGSRISAARYLYVGCLAFVTISLRNNEVCGAAGYLNHSEQCVTSQPQRDPQYKLLPYVRKSVENLLNLNVRTPDILAQNARIVKNVFENCTLIGNFRTLLTAMDITNIKKQMLQK
ncbi:28339_t:CDS:1, partial [Racocetra persica]